ncbi:MAG: DUF1294 domain-containing protein [Opitutus sp.]|nr:DUF1294 domain-containing protein [Opitutus sp.]
MRVSPDLSSAGRCREQTPVKNEEPPPHWNWLLALLVLPALALGRLGLHVDRGWLFLGAGALSLLTFAVYAADKRAAKSAAGRVPESVLHLLELLGGWPGAWVAQRVVRHKGAKLRHRPVFRLIVLAHQLMALDYLPGWPMLRSLR